MKSHALAAVIAVLVVVSVPALAQDNTQSQPSTPASVSSTDSTSRHASANANTPPSPVDDPSNTAASASAPKETHNKGINDIDDIGNRKIGNTGKSMGDWYSIDTDVKLGKQYAMMVESSARMIQDPVDHRVREPRRPEPGAQLRRQGAFHHQGCRLR